MLPEIAEVDRRAKAAGQSMLRVMSRAKVSYTTWSRWKCGDVTPTLGTLNKVRQALEELIAERSA
jgi:predicted transcriptional regulator